MKKEDHQAVLKGSAEGAWRCEVCGGTELTPLVEKDGYEYVLCSGCSVCSLNPLPDDPTLEGLYEDFLELVCDGVKMSDHFSPEYRDAYYREKDMDFEDLGYGLSAVERVLDIGCAEGIFLRYLKARHGIVGQGVDVSRHMVRKARNEGLDCSNKRLDELSGPYDLVTLWDTIEHLRDPGGSLLEINRLLKEGGDLIIQTPCRGVISDAYGPGWIQYQPPYHLHIFSYDSLMSLLERTGFSPAGMVRFGAGITDGGNAVKPVFDRIVKDLGVGDTIVVWSKKKTR